MGVSIFRTSKENKNWFELSSYRVVREVERRETTFGSSYRELSGVIGSYRELSGVIGSYREESENSKKNGGSRNQDLQLYALSANLVQS